MGLQNCATFFHKSAAALSMSLSTKTWAPSVANLATHGKGVCRTRHGHSFDEPGTSGGSLKFLGWRAESIFRHARREAPVNSTSYCWCRSVVVNHFFYISCSYCCPRHTVSSPSPLFLFALQVAVQHFHAFTQLPCFSHFSPLTPTQDWSLCGSLEWSLSHCGTTFAS